MAIFNISGPSVNQNISNQLTISAINPIRLKIFSIFGPLVNQNISNQLTVTATNAIRVKRLNAMASIRTPLGAPPEPPVVGQIWPLGLV